MTQGNGRVNPYDYVNEVTNPALFAGRERELAQLEEDVVGLAFGHVLAPMSAVVGERRIGKTSAAIRLEGICSDHNILALRLTLTELTASNSWEFWNEVFRRLLVLWRQSFGSAQPETGFRANVEVGLPGAPLDESRVEFFREYRERRATAPPNYLVDDALRDIASGIRDRGVSGILLIIDEAHLLLQNRVLTQQLRSAIRQAGKFGIVFVGETELAQLFADKSQPLFAQGQVIPFRNFASQADIAECALLPLSEDERQLVSPMTMDYLVKLSQGKPNQIRLICHSIYNRYLKGQQADLNITIEALDDILDNIAATYTDYDVRQQVEAIRTLTSVDLEALYNMTRYPDWTVSEIVELDESFRSEGKSQAALARREATLSQKREYFIRRRLMIEDAGKCVLAGDEFLALYLRFWYEIQKHGQLSRSLVLGKGPPTSFGEKIDKAIRFFSWGLGRRPAIVISTFDTHDQMSDEQVAEVVNRFEALERFQAGCSFNPGENPDVLNKWFSTCELVGKPGPYHLVYFFVRNLQNPRETAGVELYFGIQEEPLPTAEAALISLRQRAEDCKVLVEGWKHFVVQLPSLSGLLEAIGGPRIEEIMERMNTLARWHIASVQHVLGAEEETEDKDTPDPAEEPNTFGEWHELYTGGNVVEAEESLNRHLAIETERRRNAHMFNDRGYIRYSLDKKEEAKQDLQLASDFHFYNISLTLSNLAVIYIDEGDYEKAIECIHDALFLTLSAEDVSVGILRLRTPVWHRARKQNWEQHPANVLEASYVNLGFALFQSGSPEKAAEVMAEAIALMPSSPWLKHALARMWLSQNRFDLAVPIYENIAELPITDRELAHEIRSILGPESRRGSNQRRKGG